MMYDTCRNTRDVHVELPPLISTDLGTKVLLVHRVTKACYFSIKHGGSVCIWLCVGCDHKCTL